MRTTVNLAPDAHRVAKAIADQRSETMGELLTRLIMDAYCGTKDDEPMYTEDGLFAINTGGPVTVEDVRAALEEE